MPIFPWKSRFPRKYGSELQNLVQSKISRHSEWVSAPLIVPKKPPALYGMTADYRPINAATLKNTWRMLYIDAALQDIRDTQEFPGSDSTSDFWQLPHHHSRQQLHPFMSPYGVMHPTRTTRGGCNSAATFQTCVEPWFSDLRENLLAWLDYFALFDKSKEGLYAVLSTFLRLGAEYRLVISLKTQILRTPI